MSLLRLAAFATSTGGGNPAGVHLSDQLPDRHMMQAIAADVGYSETAFAAPSADGWIVRYYSPQAEVAFCGHATIALGAALGQRFGEGRFALSLSGGQISVTAKNGADGWKATLLSPPTRSAPLEAELATQLLALLDLSPDDLDPRLPLLRAHAGVDHAVLTLRSRDRLAAMAYPFEPMKRLMSDAGLTTVSLLHITGPFHFAARNAFAIGGVVEDPATGAAAAALGGALVDLGWPGLAGGGTFQIRQGEDMGAPSDLTVTVSGQRGDPVAVSGAVREIG
jgi:PhzF family phenazine biosynthesis protein